MEANEQKNTYSIYFLSNEYVILYINVRAKKNVKYTVTCMQMFRVVVQQDHAPTNQHEFSMNGIE